MYMDILREWDQEKSSIPECLFRCTLFSNITTYTFTLSIFRSPPPPLPPPGVPFARSARALPRTGRWWEGLGSTLVSGAHCGTIPRACGRHTYPLTSQVRRYMHNLNGLLSDMYTLYFSTDTRDENHPLQYTYLSMFFI